MLSLILGVVASAVVVGGVGYKMYKKVKAGKSIPEVLVEDGVEVVQSVDKLTKDAKAAKEAIKK